VTGTTFGVGGDLLLLKFSPEGTLLWELRWGGSGFEGGQDVAVGADGSVYVVGGTTTFGSGNSRSRETTSLAAEPMGRTLACEESPQ
jgi:hypothetical protein